MSTYNEAAIRPIKISHTSLSWFEKHLYSFCVKIAKPQPEKLFWIVGPTVYSAIDGAFLLHVTNKRIIIEPNNPESYATPGAITEAVLSILIPRSPAVEVNQGLATEKYLDNAKGLKGFLQISNDKNFQIQEEKGIFLSNTLIKGYESNTKSGIELRILGAVYGNDAKITIVQGNPHFNSNAYIDAGDFIKLTQQAFSK